MKDRINQYTGYFIFKNKLFYVQSFPNKNSRQCPEMFEQMTVLLKMHWSTKT